MPTKIPTAPTAAVSNWIAFKEAGLVPSKIKCEGYWPVHPSNEGCHSNLTLTAESMIRHLDAGHGGGFELTLRRTDGSGWLGWEKLAAEGIEITDFRCENCSKLPRLDKTFILPHMAPHSGNSKRVRPGGIFHITISRQLNPDYDGE